jgi:predicted transcriptional regulator
MPTSALLSIRPEFAEAILEGRKTYELRRRLFARDDVTRILVYASSPVQRVVGEFSVEKILAMEPRKLWAVTSSGAAVQRRLFDSYFEDRQVGYAIKVGKVRRYGHPMTLKESCGLERPPQSFCYLRPKGD